jgi:hypothetical protein
LPLGIDYSQLAKEHMTDNRGIVAEFRALVVVGLCNNGQPRKASLA